MVYHVEYERSLPARRPEGHVPAAPRYSLRWTHPVTTLVSDYFAIQGADLPWVDQADFFASARASFEETNGPETFEIMRSVDEEGCTNAIVVAYWRDAVKHAMWSGTSSLLRWFRDDRIASGPIGAWRETITVPYDRHETIYSGPDYRVGLVRTEGSQIVPITTNGYFGAARDRLPISAIDPLASPWGNDTPEPTVRVTRGRRLRVSVPVNMVALRSGQYWAHAEGEQLDDYVDNMRPRLMTGMDYLVNNKRATGTLALRVMTNLDDNGAVRRETSVLAHFVSLDHLERWASSHETHLDIYRHAIAMNRKFGKDRQFVSWHELFVLPQADFEYVNCHPSTGLLPFLEAVEIKR
jgi:aldoxime dehydratase